MVLSTLKHFKQVSKEEFELYLVFGKRLFDIIFSLTLLILLLPLIVSVSLLIKIFDSGPVIFKQKRVGMNQKLFYLYKFRSMPTNTKQISSDKINKINLNLLSRIIRRTNIDELPQLFNILKGDMSIVGPRPALPNQKELIGYRKKNGALFYRPGLTGLAQISSYDGMKNKIKANYDQDYIRIISFKLDMVIILKTFVYLLKPPPVY